MFIGYRLCTHQTLNDPVPCQVLLDEGEAGPLPGVMAAFARPTRIVRGKDVAAAWAVDESLFEMEEERALWGAYSGVVGDVNAGMGIRDFLQVRLHGSHFLGVFLPSGPRRAAAGYHARTLLLHAWFSA